MRAGQGALARAVGGVALLALSLGPAEAQQRGGQPLVEDGITSAGFCYARFSYRWSSRGQQAV